MIRRTIWLTLSSFIIVLCQEQVKIPEHLLECYQNYKTPTLLPMTVSVMIDLIRKVEVYPGSQMNMRMLTNSILHRFRMDGLERDPTVQGEIGIIPFRASGFQFHKFRTLFHQLIPGNSLLFPNESLSLREKCTLHFMLSSTVNPWERGDEQEVCPNSYQDYRPPVESNGVKISSCPIEQGVVLTDSGTINMGNVLAGLATALEPLEIKQSLLLTSEETKLRSGYSLNNDIINRWAATLAGDLAEAIVFQAAQTNLDMKIGFSGQWNDTYLPADYYMTVPNSPDIAKRFWQITDAELLGGIDGLILGNSVGKWTEKYSGFRLSQLLDMFYSDHGVNFDPEDRSCNRETHFENLFTKSQDILQKQIQYFAEILSTKTPHYFIESQFIEKASKELMNRFKLYYPDLLKKIKKCSVEYAQGPRLDLIIIMDATWSNYDALQLLMPLSERIDVCPYGSNVTVLNGDSGAVLINETNSISDIYLQWMNRSVIDTEINYLSLEKSLLTLSLNLEEKTEREENLKSKPRRSESPVVLVLGYSSTISDQDMKGAKNIIKGIKAQHPATKFVYLTSRGNAPRFVHLTAVPGSQTDSIVSIEDTRLLAVLPKLQGALFTVPRSLTPVYCYENKRQYLESFYEEYISPGHPLQYWIHPDYLCGSDDFAKFTFKNYDYGQLRVCMSRDQNLLGSCQETDLNKETTLFVSRPCEKQGEHLQQWDAGCLPIYFTVTAVKSLTKCSENDCKYPDQVKFGIVIQGLKCTTPFSKICSSATRLQLQYIFVIFIIVVHFITI